MEGTLLQPLPGFLSSTWHITTNVTFAVSCIGVALLVVALEFLRRLGKEYDSAMLRQFQRSAIAQYADLKTKGPSNTCGAEQVVPEYVVFRSSPRQRFIRAVIHIVTFGVAYIVMLLAIYFNGYIIISIFLGAFVGKFTCDWMV
jgi:solute carrier family 31 (copper transporter), member 1